MKETTEQFKARLLTELTAVTKMANGAARERALRKTSNEMHEAWLADRISLEDCQSLAARAKTRKNNEA